MTPEFSRPERVETIGEREREIAIEADERERARLATRFDLLAVDRLSAVFAVRREAGGIVARGQVSAAVVQPCSATGEPVPAEIDEAVALRFVADDGTTEEIELSADALDVVAYEGGAVDLGEAAAETMALALDPFPRSAGAAEALKEAGVLSEEEAGPLKAFAGLKARLEGR